MRRDFFKNMYAVSFQISYALNILIIKRLLENAHVSGVTWGYWKARVEVSPIPVLPPYKVNIWKFITKNPTAIPLKFYSHYHVCTPNSFSKSRMHMYRKYIVQYGQRWCGKEYTTNCNKEQKWEGGREEKKSWGKMRGKKNSRVVHLNRSFQNGRISHQHCLLGQ